MKTPNDPRHQTRRLALSLIYSQENTLAPITGDFSPELISAATEELKVKTYDKKFLKRILNGISEHHEEVQIIIETNSNDWDLEKIYKTDVSILMIAIWEIHYTDTPQKVVIDEAVELAKEFGGEDSPKFVNGILSGVLINYDAS